ncbi:MAG TPA: YceK/YidQ family lipoprotein [Steroidobacteraceae bacterium]|nr:YceK/YidQ family lipoprotein [Steroidobacteraceae bacterium]
MKATCALVGSCLVGLLVSGCGTVSSMTHFGRETPFVYSGTRLDIAAIQDNSAELKRFDAKSPAHPAVDLPASLVLDTILLPGTLLAAAFRAMLW